MLSLLRTSKKGGVRMSDTTRVVLGLIQTALVLGLPAFGLLCLMDVADRKATAVRRLKRRQ